MDIFTIAAAKKLAGSGGGAGSAGENGGYYTPSISEDGILTWTPSKSDMPAIAGSDLSSIGNIEFVSCNISSSFAISNFSHTFTEIEDAILSGRYIRLKCTLANGETIYGEIISYKSNFIVFTVFAELTLYGETNWCAGKLTITNENKLELTFEKMCVVGLTENYYTAEEIDEKLGNIDTLLDEIITEQETVIGGTE